MKTTRRIDVEIVYWRVRGVDEEGTKLVEPRREPQIDSNQAGFAIAESMAYIKEKYRKSHVSGENGTVWIPKKAFAG